MEDTETESDSRKEDGTEEALEEKREATEELSLSAEDEAENKHDDSTDRSLLMEEQDEVLQRLDLDQEPPVEDQEVSRTEQEQSSTAEELSAGEEHPRIDQEPETEKEQLSTEHESDTEKPKQLSIDHETSTTEQDGLNINWEQDPAVTGEHLNTYQEPTVEEQENLSTNQEPSQGEQEHLHTDQKSLEEPEYPSPYQESVLGEQERPSAGQEPTLEVLEYSVVSFETGPKMKQEKSSEDSRSEISSFDHLSSKTVTNETATVKIMLVPDGHVITLAFAITCTATCLKEYFASLLKIPRMAIQIMFEGREVNNKDTLMDLGVRPHGTIQLEMLSINPTLYPIKLIKAQQDYNLPDVIMVRVQTDADIYEDVVVEIERTTYHKPYLGGYRHKITGVEFHNAGTQTMLKRNANTGTEMFSRDTQTVSEKNRYQQCANTTSTQMTKIGCYVSNLTDKLIKPGRYVTAAEYHARRLKAVIVIQTYFRRMHAKRIVRQLRLQKMQRLEWEEKEELRKKKEKEDRMRSEYERRMNPKTKEDFELLFHILELWRLDELDRINGTFTGAERKAALCALLEQEAQYIASIGRHKHDADEGNQEHAIQFFLNKCSDPKRWTAFDGKTTEMYTQYTIHAQHLQDIYISLNIKYLTLDERLDVLLTLKHVVKEFDCKLTREIIELIDREADLMMRGVKDCNLEGLRKRIATLFLQYIKTPLFNPEVAKVLKVPPNPAVLRKNIFYCRSCKNYLPSTDFHVSVNACSIGRCRKCCKLDNEARHREDFSKYKYLLSHLQKTEAGFMDDARIAFLLQEKDVQYLVELIWAAQSALSAWNDFYDLVLVRWNKYIEWSPWNCVLLTKDEGVAHLKLKNPEEEYEVGFIHKIKFRHTLAKNYFKQIPEMVPYLHEDLSDQMSLKTDSILTRTLRIRTPRIYKQSVEQ